MISLEQGGIQFNYRVVGVAVHEHSILLHRAAGDDFWAVPGGRAELGETAAQTLKREMREELGTEVEVGRALWFVENFFSYAGRRHHEIALYFLMRLPPGSRYLVQPGPFQCQDAATPLTFQWFPQQPDVLAGLPLLPSFLPAALQRLPDAVQHVVHYHQAQT